MDADIHIAEVELGQLRALQVWVKLDREEVDALIDLLPARPR